MSDTTIGVSLDEQIKCLGRELGLRRNVFPAWVKKGRMTKEAMEREIAAMDAAYATLKALKSSREEGR